MGTCQRRQERLVGFVVQRRLIVREGLFVLRPSRSHSAIGKVRLLTYVGLIREQIGMQELHFVAKVFRQLPRVELERTWQVKQTKEVEVGAHGKETVLVAGTVRWTFVAIDRALALPAVLVDGERVDRCEPTNHADWSTEKQSREHLETKCICLDTFNHMGRSEETSEFLADFY